MWLRKNKTSKFFRYRLYFSEVDLSSVQFRFHYLMTSLPMQSGQHVTYLTQGNVVNVPANSGIEKHAKKFFSLEVSFWEIS